jgi:hypothetical protein
METHHMAMVVVLALLPLHPRWNNQCAGDWIDSKASVDSMQKRNSSYSYSESNPESYVVLFAAYSLHCIIPASHGTCGYLKIGQVCSLFFPD